MSKQRFSYLRRLEGGDSLKLFYDRDNDAYALADNSGLTPEDTDDGVLLIDTSRPMKISKGHSADYPISVSIPVRAEDEDTGVCHSGCGLIGAHTLLTLVGGMTIECNQEMAALIRAAVALADVVELPEPDGVDYEMKKLDHYTRQWARDEDAKLLGMH